MVGNTTDQAEDDCSPYRRSSLSGKAAHPMFALLGRGKVQPPNFGEIYLYCFYKSVYCCIVSPNFLILHHPAGGILWRDIIAVPQHFLTSHGVCFSSPVLRFRLGRLPLAAHRRLPSSVFGPVDNPPCRRHRPLPYRSFRLQGVPALVLAPHVCPGNMRGGGSGTSLSSCAAHRIPAHRSSMLLASVLL